MNRSRNRVWWSCLGKTWQNELIRNLLDSDKFKNRNLRRNEIFDAIDKSDEYLDEILELKKVSLTESVHNDYLNPLNLLKCIEKLYIEPPEFNDRDAANVIYMYPKHLREKVRVLKIKGIYLGDDLTVLEDFVNLEYLVYSDCKLLSLEGIQQLTKLKRVNLSQNFFSDLNPLKELSIQKLDISYSLVQDTSPLAGHTSIEWLNVCNLDLDTPHNCNFLSIPKIELIVFTEFNQPIFPEENFNVNNSIDKDRIWWDKITLRWKQELIFNLLETDDYTDFGIDIRGMYDILEYSDKHLSAIVNLEQVQITQELLYDLSPLDYLKNLQDFHIEPPDFNNVNSAHVIGMYPRHLRSKVKTLYFEGIYISDDLTPFSDFCNLEYLCVKACGVSSLNGIQKLNRLKHLAGLDGTHFTDLSPLIGLKLKTLDLKEAQVFDLSPLQYIPSLERLYIDSLQQVKDYSVLLKLPKLELIVCDKWIEISHEEIKKHIRHERFKREYKFTQKPKMQTNPIDLNPEKIPQELLQFHLSFRN